jgi:ketosteroid isomerase-like protein
MISAQDNADIHNLYALYNLSSDAGDAETYAGCFTEDGALEVQPRGLIVRGRSALVDYKNADKAGRGKLYRRHWNASLHLARIDATTVAGRAYYAGYNGEPGKLPSMTSCGVYEDRLTQGADGGWRFAHRLLLIDGRADA